MNRVLKLKVNAKVIVIVYMYIYLLIYSITIITATILIKFGKKVVRNLRMDIKYYFS